MKKKLFYAVFTLLIWSVNINAQTTPPDILFGELFSDVQMQRIFPDNKTFVDLICKGSSEEVVEKYRKEKNKKGFSLKKFVEKNFELPQASTSNYQSDLAEDVETHIHSLWNQLKRKGDANVLDNSLLKLPYPYIVPGGRFREVYYWDTYFTMLGLQISQENELIENITNNFEYLLKTYGHIPNGNRNYYLSRSQPPFFSLMVELLVEIKGDAVYQKYQEALQTEYDYWMDKTADTKHVVDLRDGVYLNRYWDQLNKPRQESFFEDSTLVAETKNNKYLYRELRSGAESGWDFSSRWFKDAKDLKTIECTDVIPVDLNSLLYHLEKTLAISYDLDGKIKLANEYEQKAKSRLDAINTYCYNSEDGWYYDYIISENKISSHKTIAGMTPFFLEIAPLGYINRAAKIVENDFLRNGGVVTTLVNSGQQWDAPNGWAPLQWIAIKGLDNYGKKELAGNIAQRWIDLNTKIYESTGKLMEKYNVEDTNITAGGGEYPAQDGFGWTNGVLLRLIQDYGKNR